MHTIPIITDKDTIALSIQKSIDQAHPDLKTKYVRYKTYDEALDFLNIDMPDIGCIDFSSTEFNPYALLDAIMSDPWLLHMGIIALCSQHSEEQRLNEMRFANIVVVICYEDINEILPRIMKIIHSNPKMLSQRVIGAEFVGAINASFELENDLHIASCHSNLVANFLYNNSRIDRDAKGDLSSAVFELLVNAIEHGNCEVTFDEKTEWTNEGRDINELLRERCKRPEIQKRKVKFSYSISSKQSKFKIVDEGNGFDWRKLPDPLSEDGAFLAHGRGILMARTFTKGLEYNEKGNEVIFEIEHSKSCVITPGIFKDIEPTSVNPGDIILHEGEDSDFLFYIVSGQYDIVVQNRAISNLSEEDMFLGEMSFLLDHKRSATVRASTAGKLIKISKRDFVEAIKKKPHYALLLARLLAKRIQRINMTSSMNLNK